MRSALVLSSFCRRNGFGVRESEAPFPFLEQPSSWLRIGFLGNHFLLNSVSPWKFLQGRASSPFWDWGLMFSSVDYPLLYLIPVSSFFLVKANPLRFGKSILTSGPDNIRTAFIPNFKEHMFKKQIPRPNSKHLFYKKPNSGKWGVSGSHCSRTSAPQKGTRFPLKTTMQSLSAT